MSDFDDLYFPPAVMFKDIFPDICAELAKLLQQRGLSGLASELKEVWIPAQGVSETDDDFSFMAYALPRLTFEQRQSIQIRDEEKIDISVSNGQIAVVTDCFGKINWFYMRGFPAEFGRLKLQIQNFLSSRRPE